ncbi:hypothetical protein CBR_g34764 [Chara braunii]|uniref:Uncharacterized protein n=1 Tax=Chara braunii TaxID=69332 RepID=A0A388LJ97_CHABU|nr:hypothetical protein CBR_g34764 [Chara braunii]|eukprot:GBG82388.1 hypothetical protein CBR_g34764 [Chara braunii]
MNSNNGAAQQAPNQGNAIQYRHPGGMPAQQGGIYQAPALAGQGPLVGGQMPVPNMSAMLPMSASAPGVAGAYTQPPPPGQRGVQMWPAPWLAPGQWSIPPVNNLQASNPQLPPPPPPPPPPSQQQASSNNDNREINSNGKGPSTNAFPGPGNRAYFTKEYMDILEDIKSNKALEDARKKIASGRRSRIRIAENNVESCRSKVKSVDKSEEMKAWVTSTLGDSLKLITQKLEQADSKSKLATVEKEELERLRAEKTLLEKGKKESSSEKRKRGGDRTPVVETPRENVGRSRSRSQTKGKTKKIEISFDEEGAGGAGVKQNLNARLEGSSDLADVKKLLAALVQGLADLRGKRPLCTTGPAIETAEAADDAEDIDSALGTNAAQNNLVEEDEEESDEGGLAAYMKMRLDFYSSLHYTRVQEMSKQRSLPYFRKEMGAWELARLDLQEYTDSLNEEAPSRTGEPSRHNDVLSHDEADGADDGEPDGAVAGK